MSSSNEEKDLSAQKLDSSDQVVNTKTPLALSTISEATKSGLQPSYTASSRGQSIDTENIHHPSNMETEEITEEDSWEEDSNLELPELEWEGLEGKFNEALKELDKKEAQILDQFDHVMEMFFIWAQTGSSHETDRAVKRLKTRERYVQLSEASFEKKKAHYVQVVSAFKTALDLLRS